MVIPDAVGTMEQQLRGIFGTRLQSFVLYGHRARELQQARREHDDGHAAHGHDAAPMRTLAVVDTMTPDDLRACAKCVDAWHDAGLATPLLVAARELEHSLDAFPLEFGAILADHTVVSGANPFASLTIDPADVRRACEVQARSHLLHLREGFLETRGRSDALADLIVQSAAAFAALVASVARLEGHPSDDRAAAARHVERILNAPGAVTEVTKLAGLHEIASDDAERIFPPYLDAVDRLVSYVDGWKDDR